MSEHSQGCLGRKGARLAVALHLLALGLGGCGEVSPQLPEPTIEPPPAQLKQEDEPVPLPASWPRLLGKPGRLHETFQQEVSDWKDVRLDGHSYDWLLPGVWRLTPPGQTPRGWLHDEIRRAPAASFRRYAGTAFGTPDGELPARYQVSVTVTPLDAHPQSDPPVGDLGIPLYYLDPAHYVEAVLRSERFEIWACDGGLPATWKGWHPLYQADLKTAGGQSRRVTAEVDAYAGTMTVSVDGTVMASVKHRLIQPYTHYVALRATGNRVIFSDVNIEGE